MKRFAGAGKDVRALREEYEGRKKKRSEKKVEEILNLMKKGDEKSTSICESNPTRKTNGFDSKIPQTGRTLSIAVPASILDNAQSAELRTYLGGQIARAACIFNVDEVIESFIYLLMSCSSSFFSAKHSQ